jgi:hypothetical protein
MRSRVVAFLSPLRGLALISAKHPRLAPWAAIYRRFAAGVSQACGVALHGVFSRSY